MLVQLSGAGNCFALARRRWKSVFRGYWLERPLMCSYLLTSLAAEQSHPGGKSDTKAQTEFRTETRVQLEVLTHTF